MTISEANSPIIEPLKRMIENKGIKKRVLAERIGLTPSELSCILNGRRIAKPIDISLLSIALDCTPNELFDQKVRPPAPAKHEKRRGKLPVQLHRGHMRSKARAGK